MAQQGRGETAPPEATFKSDIEALIRQTATNIAGLREDRSAINADITEQFATLKAKGVSTKAVKLAIWLKDQDPEVRADTLEWLEIAVSCMGLAPQRSLNFGDAPAPADDGQDEFGGDFDTAGAPDFDDEPAAKAGDPRADGRAAAFDGKAKSDCPYEGAEKNIWESGWLNGRKEAKRLASSETANSAPA